MNNHSDILYLKETVRSKGVPQMVNAVCIEGQTFLVRGLFSKVAELKYIWQEDVKDPETVIGELRHAAFKIDILKFWQRIPDTEKKYAYFNEWQHPAAIPITTHEHWFQKQLNQKARNKIRKSAKMGLTVREEPLSDRLIQGIIGIYNDSPLRRGKPFWHYGKGFDTVKQELEDDPVKSTYITAYWNDELIGFVKVLFYDRFARTTLILDKQSRRNIGSMNSMISKIVELCAEKGITLFVYSHWRRGNHGQFQKSNGFVKYSVPEYFVPITLKGKIILFLKLHRGIKGWIPEKCIIFLLDVRAWWLARRYKTKVFRVASK